MSQFPKTALTVGGDNPFLPSLLAAINHADDIAIATAFIRMTGIRLIQTALEDALERGARVRILTGDYLGVTDPHALRYLMLLQEQGADVKVFESQGKTSFHMKAYLFTLDDTAGSNEGCAFIGSSNLSHAALVSGLEWNLKVDQAEDEVRFAHILTEYEALYAKPSCKTLSHQWIDNYIKRIPDAAKALPAATEPGQDEKEPPPEPNSIQKEALEALANSRENGFRRGLVVLATGLGKTWLSAFDSQQMNARRVLFVAHREEILKQAEETFVRIRPDVKVGRYNGVEKKIDVDMLFASIQTLGMASHLRLFDPGHFDYIIVDEFHHAAARTYQQLLIYFKPRFLLGLTATPDRTDQSDILSLCDDNLVYTKDLFYGIETKLLCPFTYYGIADEVNYQEITWRNGKFDPQQLESQLATNARARHNFKHWQDRHQTRTLAFCISKKHADFMAGYFIQKGVRAASVHSDSKMRRNEALSSLEQGELQVIFSVDLFNEGIDLPAIDTVLMLRPTESKIIFLQQLGRGLRNCPGTKDKLIILDFIGNHVSFFRKPEALFNVGVTAKERKAFIDDVRGENLNLPMGCFVNYDLESIDFMEQLVANKSDKQVEIYRSLKESLDRRPSLAEFYRVGGSVDTIRKEYGQWHSFLKDEEDLNEQEIECLSVHENFLRELETTNLNKSFKLVLLEALMELDGFTNPPTTIALALRSFEVLQRRRILLSDLPDKFRQNSEISISQEKSWHKYWSDNPINAWIGGNVASASVYFQVEKESFYFKHPIVESVMDAFALLVQELVDFRFRQYESRIEQQSSIAQITIPDQAAIEIPFFTDLKVACGHFRESPHDNTKIDYRPLPSKYGVLESARHFIAQASGSSMDGGNQPIKDGEYLLFELLASGMTASSIVHNEIREPNVADTKFAELGIVVAENREGSGHEFLVRNLEEGKSGGLVLAAQNSSYPSIPVTPAISLVAKLKGILDPLELQLHRNFMRADIPPLFGLEFNKAVWETGHVCPKGFPDQILLVTLNKQGKNRSEQYHDYFIDNETFHWQSQNSTGPTGKKGKGIIEHRAVGSRVHLFVRKNKLQDGKAAPFIYCGMLDYQSHKSEKPMNVLSKLQAPLSAQLYNYFTA